MKMQLKNVIKNVSLYFEWFENIFDMISYFIILKNAKNPFLNT